MDLNLDPRWGVLKAAVLEAVGVLILVFAPLDIAKTVPPSGMVMVY